jgi:prevent-host-death family protein
MAERPKHARTRAISSAEAKLKLAQLLDDVYAHGTRYIIQRFDTPRAVVISLADYQRLLAVEKAGAPILREAQPRYHLGEDKTPEEIEALLGVSADERAEEHPYD